MSAVWHRVRLSLWTSSKKMTTCPVESDTSQSESFTSKEHEFASNSLWPPWHTKKARVGTAVRLGTGKFKSSWRLPPHITSSSKGSRFASCKLYASNFCISHGDLNDVKWHANGPAHKRKLTEIGQNIRIDNFIVDKTHVQIESLLLIICLVYLCPCFQILK